MSGFQEALHIDFFPNAEYFASDLFFEAFRRPFPVPREHTELSIPTPPENWRQEIAFYKWSETELEVVGFCNWIRHGDCYLGGGLCMRETFYYRLPQDHFETCRELGGVAQMMLDTALVTLTDCIAWFGYCGDRRAYKINMRAGYQRTRHEHLIVKWRAELPDSEKRKVEDQFAAIGPF
jgi:hypothetical protein